MESPGKINDRKCYNCGTEFRAPALLLRHGNRKTPCLIRNVSDADVDNPKRCIFCNKIFASVGNKNKHVKNCKIRNSGIKILAGKVKHEQTEQKDEEIKSLRERVELLETKLNEIKRN